MCDKVSASCHQGTPPVSHLHPFSPPVIDAPAKHHYPILIQPLFPHSLPPYFPFKLTLSTPNVGRNREFPFFFISTCISLSLFSFITH